MRLSRFALVLPSMLCAALVFTPGALQAAKVTVDLGDSGGVKLVGALLRWDQDGNHLRPVNKDAKINAPEVEATAVDSGGNRWVFADLKPGNYDLVILAEPRIRIEGWRYPPVLEFDPFFSSTAATDDETREFITADIHKSPHYENKVEPLYMGGDKKVVRVLVQLIRDKPTSYKEVKNAGTMRHEVWQYSWNYGGWQKEKRTKVLDRVLLSVDELRQWTWLWEPKLGGIEVKNSPITIKYHLPKKPDPQQLKGLYPY